MTALFLFIQLAFGEILLQGEPLQSEPIVFQVVDDLSKPIASATVRIRVHPDLPSGSDWTLGVTDSEGRITFKPEHGGPHQIHIGSQSLDFRVSWSRYPLPAGLSYLAIFLGAGLLTLLRQKRRG